MKPLQATTAITIDDQSFDVANLSPEIQDLVEFFDDWRQREKEIVSDLAMVRRAMQNLQSELLVKMQQALSPQKKSEPESTAQDVVAKPARNRGRK